MSKLLHILASPRVESYSTRVAKAFLDSYRRAQPDDHIDVLDLARADIPPFHAPQAKAKYAVAAGQAPRDEAEAAWQPVIKTINHFKVFDKYVLSSPMWNFGVPYRLKQYIDVIVQPSLTVALDEECRTQFRLSVETRTSAYQVRTGDCPEEQLSVYVTARQYGSLGPDKTFVETVDRLRQLCHETIDSHVIEQILQPLGRAISLQ